MSSEMVMVVDDDVDLREGIVEILENHGYQVVACDNAEAALQTIKETLPRVIVLDNMMPGMGGMALVPLLKREYPEVRIIMITAFSTVDNAVTAMKSGADDYLANPIRRRILDLLVENCEMRFMDITRTLGIADHTKVGFHLKNLKGVRLIDQNREKSYRLTPQGKKITQGLQILAQQISA
jgi:DNA-binding NtrC family response regulator